MPAYPAVDDAAAPTPPSLIELFQKTYGVCGVPVKPVGPVSVQPLPSRCGAIASLPFAAAGTGERYPAQLLGEDLRRKRVVLVSDVDWIYARAASDRNGVPIPKSVPLVLEHCDAIYAMTQTAAGTLSAIVENWAD